MESRSTWFDEGRRHFDYIVIGCGGIGSATVYWLSKQVKGDVLGIEQFKLGHVNGGSQDHSRIIRLSYPDDRYTKLAPHTYQTWNEVEQESGMKIVYKCGGLNMAKIGEGDHIINSFAAAMDRANIQYERLNKTELERKFPQFELKEDVVSLYQKDSGLVDAAVANSTHQQLARGHGASIISNCAVIRLYRNTLGQMTVKTTRGKFTCRRVIVTAGAWINQILGSVGVNLPITVTQENVTYFASPHSKLFSKERFPIFIYHAPNYNYYQIPIHGNSSTKIGIDAVGKTVTPTTRDFTPCPEREQNVIEFMNKIAPKIITLICFLFQFLGPIMETKCCLYAMTPDRHFVIDTCHRTGYSDVIVCNGAGHAFKWASLLGKILSQLAIDGKTQYDISSFTMDREALTNPNYKPHFHLTGLPVPAKL
ncbi:hypothetical protein LOTGIDRAFT_227305 [Lottia gigantea]|uniref:FAD dependent oxidoreductase domain-containing protein n=1 Tax=Lottia gigantea TaxID=225164 RepID=V4AJP3_LOTGI|nr:hypothetical protein LOTGIDRAFT_227305 [Lottia gigantea]ESO94925.1 hypothetical protein LOTGIDRAFT_227305 [Lottia gigantea]